MIPKNVDTKTGVLLFVGTTHSLVITDTSAIPKVYYMEW